VIAIAVGKALGEMTERSPSPRRGEGRGEGASRMRNPTVTRSNTFGILSLRISFAKLGTTRPVASQYLAWG
jgi:hypothetical protein